MTKTWKVTTKTPDPHPQKWDSTLQRIAEAIGSDFQAGINQIVSGFEDSSSPGQSNVPFRVLVSTIISLRTRDEVTIPASRRLLHEAPDAPSLAALPTQRIQELIYPAGFYKNKARNLKEIAGRLVREYGGAVPDSKEGLTSFSGIGPKTANLVLGLGFGIDAICVDTHVHRIPNRLGWISTRTPQETEQALMEVLPRKFWIPINGLLVGFGQQICTPVSPRCSVCPLSDECPRTGVTHHR
ncbi:MAG TPA: endonuclease III [Alkalispirochaeta sp.]|nr:endonuclease III [Alkalispirochaeta sp.]